MLGRKFNLLFGSLKLNQAYISRGGSAQLSLSKYLSGLLKALM
jgi:hypothetical protein